MKKKSHNLKKIALLAVIAIFGVVNFNCAKNTDVIEFEKLTSEFNKSKENVRSKYDGKEITVRGYAKVPPAFAPEGKGISLITVAMKETSLNGLQCWIEEADASEFKQIKGHQFIIVKGIFNGEGYLPELKFCKLVKVE